MDDGVDFAVAAFRADGEWQVEDLTHDHLGDIATLASALRRFPGDAGALAMVADRRGLLRPGPGRRRRHPGPALGHHGRGRVGAGQLRARAPRPAAPDGLDDDEDDDPVPAGHLDLLSDLGMPAMDLGVAAGRPGPLPRRDPLRRREPARLRRALRRHRRLRLGLCRTVDPWLAPMRAALDEARAALATGDVPIGAVVADAGRAGDRPGPQRAGGPGRPDRPRRGGGPPRGRRASAGRGGSTAAPWS